MCCSSRRNALRLKVITEGTQIRKILDHIGVDSEPPQISPTRSPSLWDDCSDAQTNAAVHMEPDWDLAVQPAPHFEVDQRVNWRMVEAAILNRCALAMRPIYAALCQSLL